MIKLLPLSVLVVAVLGVVQAQSPIVLSDFLTNRATDTLEFENIMREQLQTHTIVFLPTHNTMAEILRAESDGQQLWEKLEAQAWQLYALQIDNHILNLEKPLPILPADAQASKMYTAQCNYTTTGKKGTLTIEAFSGGFESAATPLRNFIDCLKVEIRLTMLENSRQVYRIDRIEWYARGIGLVKMIKNTYRNGARTTVDAALLKATLGGKPLEGRKK